MTTPALLFSHQDPEKTGSQYVGEDDSDKLSDTRAKTVTRITTLGEHAGTVRNYNSQGQTILLPTPSDDV